MPPVNQSTQVKTVRSEDECGEQVGNAAAHQGSPRFVVRRAFGCRCRLAWAGRGEVTSCDPCVCPSPISALDNGSPSIPTAWHRLIRSQTTAAVTTYHRPASLSAVLYVGTHMRSAPSGGGGGSGAGFGRAVETAHRSSGRLARHEPAAARATEHELR